MISINSEDASLIVASICVSLSSFFAGGICLGLSGIARSVLYQREVLRQKYDFEFMQSVVFIERKTTKQMSKTCPFSFQLYFHNTDYQINYSLYMRRFIIMSSRDHLPVSLQKANYYYKRNSSQISQSFFFLFQIAN